MRLSTIVISRGPTGDTGPAGDTGADGVLTADGTTELDDATKANLAIQWPEAVAGPIQPVFLSETSLDVNATATTAAIQAAIDTRRAVFIPAGVYKLNATIALKTQGQHIIGESGTRTILEWITDVDGFEIQESTESDTTNFPSSSVTSSSWGRVENLLLNAPAASTSTAFKNTESANPTLWVGEGWRIDFCIFMDWDKGIYSSKAARYNSRSLVFKNCTTGLHLDTGGSSTNNCHVFYGLTFSNCTTGADLDGVNGGWFQLQDTSTNDVDVNVSSSQVHIEGGQLEAYVTKSILIQSASRVSMANVRFLGSTSLIPVSVNGSSSLQIVNSRQAQAGNTVPLVEILDSLSKVWGSPADNQTGTVPGDLPTSQVRLFGGDDVYLTPLNWRAGTDLPSTEEKHRGLLHWRKATGTNNLNLDDLQAMIEVNGEYVRAGAFKTNHFSYVFDSGLSYQAQGWEDLILVDTGSTRTVQLRGTNSAYYRASDIQLRVFRIVDETGEAGTRNITITATGTDMIEGAGSYTISTNYGGVTLATRGNGRWVILNEKT